MDASHIELPGCEVEALERHGAQVRIRFSRAFIVKSMTGAFERTRWWQAGDLLIEGVEGPVDLPQGPLKVTGGDVYDNIYTYRDLIPLPLETAGQVGCRLLFEGVEAPLEVRGTRLRLEMKATPRYIEHIHAG